MVWATGRLSSVTPSLDSTTAPPSISKTGVHRVFISPRHIFLTPSSHATDSAHTFLTRTSNTIPMPRPTCPARSALPSQMDHRSSRRPAARNAAHSLKTKTVRSRLAMRNTAPSGRRSSRTLYSRSRVGDRQTCEIDSAMRSLSCIKPPGTNRETCLRRKPSLMDLDTLFLALQPTTS